MEARGAGSAGVLAGWVESAAVLRPDHVLQEQVKTTVEGADIRVVAARSADRRHGAALVVRYNNDNNIVDHFEDDLPADDDVDGDDDGGLEFASLDCDSD